MQPLTGFSHVHTDIPFASDFRCRRQCRAPALLRSVSAWDCHRYAGSMARMTSLDNWVHQQLTGERTPAKPPGPILLVFVTVAVAVWVCVKRNWWPSRFGAHTWADPLLAHLVVLVRSGRRWPGVGDPNPLRARSRPTLVLVGTPCARSRRCRLHVRGVRTEHDLPRQSERVRRHLPRHPTEPRHLPRGVRDRSVRHQTRGSRSVGRDPFRR